MRLVKSAWTCSSCLLHLTATGLRQAALHAGHAVITVAKNAYRGQSLPHLRAEATWFSKSNTVGLLPGEFANPILLDVSEEEPGNHGPVRHRVMAVEPGNLHDGQGTSIVEHNVQGSEG